MRLLFCLLIGCLLLAQTPPSSRPTFSTTTNVVIVNVTVLDRNGRPIETLKKDDFQVFEDGKLQKLSAVDLQHLMNQSLPALTETAAAPTPEKPKG